MNTSDVKRGEDYQDRDYGRVRMIAPHPDDGSYLIVQLLGDPDNIDNFKGTVADRLTAIA